jgi:hypothetical protein
VTCIKTSLCFGYFPLLKSIAILLSCFATLPIWSLYETLLFFLISLLFGNSTFGWESLCLELYHVDLFLAIELINWANEDNWFVFVSKSPPLFFVFVAPAPSIREIGSLLCIHPHHKVSSHACMPSLSEAPPWHPNRPSCLFVSVRTGEKPKGAP